MASRYPVPALRACTMAIPETETRLRRGLSPEFCFRMEEEIRRSRFITSLGRAPDKDAARVFVDAVRKEFPAATHNCWAYAAGAPGDTANIGQSDDGEPHGTAGRPMLTQLSYGGVGEIVAVVTRYFGGIKLGAGGLVRAYQGGVAQALSALPTEEKTVPVQLALVVDYAHIHVLHRLLPDFQAKITSEQFGTKITYSLEVPEDKIKTLRAAIVQATDGTARFLATDPKADQL